MSFFTDNPVFTFNAPATEIHTVDLSQAGDDTADVDDIEMDEQPAESPVRRSTRITRRKSPLDALKADSKRKGAKSSPVLPPADEEEEPIQMNGHAHTDPPPVQSDDEAQQDVAAKPTPQPPKKTSPPASAGKRKKTKRRPKKKKKAEEPAVEEEVEEPLPSPVKKSPQKRATRGTKRKAPEPEDEEHEDDEAVPDPKSAVTVFDPKSIPNEFIKQLMQTARDAIQKETAAFTASTLKEVLNDRTELAEMKQNALVLMNELHETQRQLQTQPLQPPKISDLLVQETPKHQSESCNMSALEAAMTMLFYDNEGVKHNKAATGYSMKPMRGVFVSPTRTIDVNPTLLAHTPRQTGKKKHFADESLRTSAFANMLYPAQLSTFGLSKYMAPNTKESETQFNQACRLAEKHNLVDSFTCKDTKTGCLLFLAHDRPVPREMIVFDDGVPKNTRQIVLSNRCDEAETSSKLRSVMLWRYICTYGPITLFQMYITELLSVSYRDVIGTIVRAGMRNIPDGEAWLEGMDSLGQENVETCQLVTFISQFTSREQTKFIPWAFDPFKEPNRLIDMIYASDSEYHNVEVRHTEIARMLRLAIIISLEYSRSMLGTVGTLAEDPLSRGTACSLHAAAEYEFRIEMPDGNISAAAMLGGRETSNNNAAVFSEMTPKHDADLRRLVGSELIKHRVHTLTSESFQIKVPLDSLHSGGTEMADSRMFQINPYSLPMEVVVARPVHVGSSETYNFDPPHTYVISPEYGASRLQTTMHDWTERFDRGSTWMITQRRNETAAELTNVPQVIPHSQIVRNPPFHMAKAAAEFVETDMPRGRFVLSAQFTHSQTKRDKLQELIAKYETAASKTTPTPRAVPQQAALPAPQAVPQTPSKQRKKSSSGSSPGANGTPAAKRARTSATTPKKGKSRGKGKGKSK